MAKVVKSTRDIVDINEELDKVQGSKSKPKVKEEKKEDKKKVTKKDTNKSQRQEESFFKGVKKEVSKVSWPSKKEMVKYSIATIVFVVFFGIFFYLIDLILALLKTGV